MTLVIPLRFSVVHSALLGARTPPTSMNFEEPNGRVVYDPIDANYRVYWQDHLMRPTFPNRLAALRYLGALRNGLRKPDFAEQLPAPETNVKNCPDA